MAHIVGSQPLCLHQRTPAYKPSPVAPQPCRRTAHNAGSKSASQPSSAAQRLCPVAAVSAVAETVKPSQDLQQLSGKPAAQQSTVIITGANSGLGLAATAALAKTGGSLTGPGWPARCGLYQHTGFAAVPASELALFVDLTVGSCFLQGSGTWFSPAETLPRQSELLKQLAFRRSHTQSCISTWRL